MGKEDGGLGWGGSLSVPSVQEIVRNDSGSVPERYIRQLEDRPSMEPTMSDSSPEIPVIDMSLLAKGDRDELGRLDFACREWGFFQGAVAAFFDLPLQEKRKYVMAENDIEGYGQGYVVSEQQKLDWGDLMFLMTLPSEHHRFKYWPLMVPGFKEAVDKYSGEIYKVTLDLLSDFSYLMGMERDSLKMLHGDVMKQGIRMNYYPTCSRPDLVLGVSPHSDGSSITLLLQDDEISGLQVKHRGGWVTVKPIPNAIVVNVGDVMEAWSNGRYKSIEHRAITNDKRTRMSIATFVLPDEEIIISPVPTMVDDDQNPRMYKNIKYIDYIRHTLGQKMDGKAHTEYLKL
ncbi:hypothetical protein CRG98_007218 [Punica granatum]|uniref:Fe2OG dioxygenase domain-containing protein n=1 Tax=Punica granatum TaxID=22663 RepID=A0A2I0KV50_PUNGR|nr:hypothetical protein CRG98_007218 [Punica granatum]